MAKYGEELYGEFTYGSNAASEPVVLPFIAFDVRPFTATSIDYNKIFLEWNSPIGDWDRIRLVRNGFGFPITPDDGDVLFEGTETSDVRSYLDEGQVPNNSGLIEGRTYYYTVFVREVANNRWISAGTALGVSVINFGTAELMYEYLPAIYKIQNPYSAEINDSEVNSDLFGFLQVFAFEHDLFKTYTLNLKNRYDPLSLDGRLVPLLLNEFGFAFEREIGLQQARSLLQNAIKIYSQKGSLSGLLTFITAFTGFNSRVRPPVNLMLDYNNSSFKETIGFWEATANGTLSRGTLDTEVPITPPYSEPNSPTNFPNYTTGFLKVVATAAADVTLSCGVSAPLTRGIPVVAGETYTFTAYIRPRDEERVVSTNIRWYDRFGAFISASTAASFTTSLELWRRTADAVGVAPAGAYFAVPEITIEDCVIGEITYVDAAQFELSNESTTFADARRVDVILGANRINQVLNPSFENSLANWAFAGGTAALANEGALENSEYSVKITADNTTLSSATTSSKVSVQSGDQNAVSAYVKGTAGSTALVKLVWYDDTVSVISDTATTAVAITLDDWTRLELTALAPTTAVTAEIVVEAVPADVGSEIFIDAVLFEKAAFVSPYFDGGAGYAQLNDVVWETGNDEANSRSHYYKNREVATKRLIEVLGDYISAGSPWAVFVAQPD